jgi:hypothetical protein
VALSLTYSQIRESELFAWHAEGYLFHADELLRAVSLCPPASAAQNKSAARLRVTHSSLHGTEEVLSLGWHHLEGCTCRFCLALDRNTAPTAVPRGEG